MKKLGNPPGWSDEFTAYVLTERQQELRLMARRMTALDPTGAAQLRRIADRFKTRALRMKKRRN